MFSNYVAWQWITSLQGCLNYRGTGTYEQVNYKATVDDGHTLGEKVGKKESCNLMNSRKSK